MVLLLFSCKNTCYPGGRCVLATSHRAHQGLPWCFHLLQPLSRHCNPPRKPVRSGQAICSGALVLWESGESRRTEEFLGSVNLSKTASCLQTSVHQKWPCLPGPGAAELVMETGRKIVEWSTRGPSIALAKGNQLFKLLGENLDTSLTIFLASAANSDMVVKSSWWDTQKEEATITFC